MVRAKFTCRLNANGQIVLEAVTGGSAENAGFFKYTPSGKLEMSVVNEAAAAHFVVGHDYYLDFMPAGPAAATVPHDSGKL